MLLNPISSADLFGLVGIAGGCTAPFDEVAVLVLGGRLGRPGKGGGDCTFPFVLFTFGADTVGLSGTLGVDSSCTAIFFSGKGGRLEGSYSGAIMRPLLVLLPLAPPRDMPEMEERPDATDEILSTDCLREIPCSEGRRAGSAGEAFSLPLLGGSGGLVTAPSLPSHFFITGAGSTFFATCVCVGGSGGARPLSGRLPMCPFALPLPTAGDVLCVRFGKGGGGAFFAFAAVS